MFKNFKDNFEKFLISFILFFIGFITLVSLITYNQKDNSFLIMTLIFKIAQIFLEPLVLIYLRF